MNINTFERHRKIYDIYLAVIEKHGKYASQIKKRTIYEEVARETNYSVSLVQRVILSFLQNDNR